MNGFAKIFRTLVRTIRELSQQYKEFSRDFDALKREVADSIQTFENGNISSEELKSQLSQAITRLNEIFPEHVSKSLDVIYPNWESKVLGIREEHLPTEANSECSPEELAEAYREGLADGGFHFITAVDYIVASMTDPERDSFFSEPRNSEVPGVADGDFHFAITMDYIVASMTDPERDSFFSELRHSEVLGVEEYDRAFREYIQRLHDRFSANGESDEFDEEANNPLNGVPEQVGGRRQAETDNSDTSIPTNPSDNTDSQEMPTHGAEFDERNGDEQNVPETSPSPTEELSPDISHEPINNSEPSPSKPLGSDDMEDQTAGDFGI